MKIVLGLTHNSAEVAPSAACNSEAGDPEPSPEKRLGSSSAVIEEGELAIQRIGIARGRFEVPEDIDRLNEAVKDLFAGR